MGFNSAFKGLNGDFRILKIIYPLAARNVCCVVESTAQEELFLSAKDNDSLLPT